MGNLCMHFGLAHAPEIRYTDGMDRMGEGPDLQLKCNKRQRGVYVNEKAEEDAAVYFEPVHLPFGRYAGLI